MCIYISINTKKMQKKKSKQDPGKFRENNTNTYSILELPWELNPKCDQPNKATKFGVKRSEAESRMSDKFNLCKIWAQKRSDYF